jgi:hypothetical protein
MNQPHPIISRLIRDGAWPIGNLNDIPKTAIQSIAPDEEALCLLDPVHFRTVGREVKIGVPEFWEKYGALSEIDPERYLIIGDFGLGSDAPIIIDSDPNSLDPEVRRLAYSFKEGMTETHWITFFDHLSEFAKFLYEQK